MRALLALANVGSQRASLVARQRAVELPRDRPLSLRAGQAPLELLAHTPPSAKQERLDRRGRYGEDAGDLGDWPPFELAHHERGALLSGNLPKRADQIIDPHAWLVADEIHGIGLELDFRRAPRGLAKVLKAQIVRDRPQPTAWRARALAAQQRPIGVQERRLGDVLRVGRAVQHHQRIAIHSGGVTPIERFERPLGPSAQAQRARHGLTLAPSGPAYRSESGRALSGLRELGPVDVDSADGDRWREASRRAALRELGDLPMQADAAARGRGCRADAVSEQDASVRERERLVAGRRSMVSPGDHHLDRAAVAVVAGRWRQRRRNKGAGRVVALAARSTRRRTRLSRMPGAGCPGCCGCGGLLACATPASPTTPTTVRTAIPLIARLPRRLPVNQIDPGQVRTLRWGRRSATSKVRSQTDDGYCSRRGSGRRGPLWCEEEGYPPLRPGKCSASADLGWRMVGEQRRAR